MFHFPSTLFTDSYQKAIDLYESDEAYQGLSITEDMLANLNYQAAVSYCVDRLIAYDCF